ncbi:hypothetical protein HY625_02055, partial [Candidatus Uhrbacteria bacterium]|nr:hypothetical protein [Candidatus Uhrbacteria bacterium]
MEFVRWRTLVEKLGVVLACIIHAEEILKEPEQEGEQFTLRSLADCELIAICNDVPESVIGKAALAILKARFINCACEQYISHTNDAKKGTPFFDYLVRRVRATATSFAHWMAYWFLCFEAGVSEETFTLHRLRETEPSPAEWLSMLDLKLGSAMRESVVGEIIDHPDTNFDVLGEALVTLASFDGPENRSLAEKVFVCMQNRYSSFDDWYWLLRDFLMEDFWDNRFLVEAAKRCQGDPKKWKKIIGWYQNETPSEVLVEIRKDIEDDTARYRIDVWIDLARRA